MKVHVAVTGKHIGEGVPGSSIHCAVACALRDVLADVEDLTIDPVPWPNTSVTLYQPIAGQYLSGVLPPEAIDFALAYDALSDVEPFEFDLELKNDADDYDE